MAVSRTNKNTVAGLLDEANAAITNELVNPNGTNAEVGERATRNIKARTQGGTDKFGRSLTAYAESTRIRKRKKGQRIRPPTLTDSEQMLNDMTTQAIGGTFVINQSNNYQIANIVFKTRRSEQIAARHISGTSKMPQRDFFGMTDEHAEQLAEFYGVALRRVIPTDKRRKIKVFLFRA